MKLNTKKLTLAALTLVCFWIAFERCVGLYQEIIPIGPSGACYDIRYPNFKNHYKMEIIGNDLETHSSFVAITLLNDKSVSWEDQYTFSQLRTINPHRIECK